MLDGKSVNAVMALNSSQSCNVCFAKPSDMNNLVKIRMFTPDEKSLKMGISTLHCWVKLLEYVLHLGYKIKIKKYQAISEEHKLSVVEQKNEIQNRFRSELSLVIDMPKHGYGSSNTGNTARKAFENADTFADIKGVDFNIIVRLRNIMKAVCSGYHLDLEAFKKYCLATSEMIIEKYNWYIMPPTVHKLLEHGYQISDCFELPIGVYSEESQEAQNKYI
ncbi:uncharacterized protein LOC124808507 [Hydra vulgaris]|uniref:uncharacterized protein LOC124808507 n=1 Tax=Hydra vulgaris TaxID=6087 RepID=UPI0032E9BF81